MVDQMMPTRTYRKIHQMPESSGPASSGKVTRLPARQSGYIRYLDLARLVKLAARHGVQVRVLRRVGDFIPAGVDIMSVAGAFAEHGDDVRGDLLACMEIGPTRTLQQDIEFGVLQIVDIALKAISPAVNDPSTAIACVDQLSRILVRVVGREPGPALLQDDTGANRVVVSWPDLPRLLDAAFEHIRLYARTDLAVSLRLLKALGDLACMVVDPSDWVLIRERGERVYRGCVGRMDAGEMQLLEQRWTQTCTDWPELRRAVPTSGGAS